MNETNIDQGIIEHTLPSWRGFGDFIATQHANCPAYIYRGQADATWKIASTLDRLEARHPRKKNHWGDNPDYFECTPVPRNEHLAAFQEVVRGKRGAIPPALTENEWWAMAQHHGLATPILDWTYSPFIAMFFAFEEHGYIDYIDRQTGNYREPENRAIYVVPFHLIDQKGTDKHPAPSVFTVRREITDRLNSQLGLFMKMPEGVELESSVRARFTDETNSTKPGGNLHPNAVLTRIIIPNEGRIECLKFLNKLNVNRMTLFPDLDGAARYVNSLWELDFDTALGAVADVSKPNAT